MVCGEGPFNHTNDSETLTKIMDCSYLFPDHLSEGCKRYSFYNFKWHIGNWRSIKLLVHRCDQSHCSITQAQDLLLKWRVKVQIF